MKSGGRLFLIDGSSFCYRAFYAIRELSTSKGQPTNAVYGVVAMLRRLVEEEKPEYLAVAFDLPGPTFRHRRYEGYKEHRRPMPDALVDQLPWIREVLAAFRVPVFEREGYEADDVLGTIARRAEAEGLTVYLVTGDKDALQLVGERVKIYRPVKDGHEILDDRTLSERWRLRPQQVVDVMALMGDEVDAIPGVPGVGEKTAVGLIQKFGSVDRLVRHLEKEKKPQVRPGVAQAIREHAEQVRMSRELATLDTDVPLKLKVEELARREPDRAALHGIFQKLEFRALAKEFAPEALAGAVRVERAESPADLSRLRPALREAGTIGVALAPDGAVALSWEEGKALLACGPGALKELGWLWTDVRIAKAVPGLKELTVRLLRAQASPPAGPGAPLGEGWDDPCIASYVLDPTRPSHRLPDLAAEFLGEGIGSDDAGEKAAQEALVSRKMMPRMRSQMEEKGLGTLYREVEIPLARVLARMEHHGIAVDPKAFEALSKELQAALARLTGEIHRLAGGEFNINSPKQLQEILFGTLKLPVVRRTKTGASTDEEVLRRLSTMHELPAKVLEYRELAKLSSTYVEALPRLVDPNTGRIHCSFNQTVTATGRLSSSSPNLQNIPIRAELGRQIRRAFVPSREGWLFLAADYSQVELRILAHLSGDPALVEAFRRGEDIHRVTAADVFGVAPPEVTGKMRAAAKTINFGIVYGMTSFGLSKELEMELGQAEEFIGRYFARYPKVREYLDQTLEETKRRGYCTTLLNRRRYIPELQAKEPTVRQFAERMAVNAPIQGSAADLIKVAMVAIDAELEQKGWAARMLLQVHDELVFELPPGEMERVQGLVRERMEQPRLSGRPIRLEVPVVVNLKTGRNWYEASHD
ncbi:MAG: DNA polymerase I [Candidatus Omnitrophica bacterium]|nr:DNA polymerase I [Candidatus Omnitrophota bacterium]